MMRNSYLILEDGTVFEGKSFGATVGNNSAPWGEVVFNTGMSGYVEIISDPSYTGQIVVMTSPHIGNYGVSEDWLESETAGLSALVVRSLYTGRVPEGRISLDTFLRGRGIPGITEIDTRALTLKIRNEGSCNGLIITPESEKGVLSEYEKEKALGFLQAAPPMTGRNLVKKTGTKERYVLNSSGTPHITVVDCGIKGNILRGLTERGCKVTVVPSTTTAKEILDIKNDGVLFSNGPGDPAVLEEIVSTTKKLAGKIPLSGICLGHQIIGLALGAKTVKMKFGHHGINHPVRDLETGRVIITSQNHGFTLVEETLPEKIEVWMRNSNDGSIEGIRSRELSIISTQFHPESAPGPHDSLWIFDEIIRLMKA